MHLASHRLRSCTSCSPAGKQRDRDVQGARFGSRRLPRGVAPNMLWITQSEYFGLERPSYLSRPLKTQNTVLLATSSRG